MVVTIDEIAQFANSRLYSIVDHSNLPVLTVRCSLPGNGLAEKYPESNESIARIVRTLVLIYTRSALTTGHVPVREP